MKNLSILLLISAFLAGCGGGGSSSSGGNKQEKYQGSAPFKKIIEKADRIAGATKRVDAIVEGGTQHYMVYLRNQNIIRVGGDVGGYPVGVVACALVHEKTHAIQNQRGDAATTCAESTKNELEAFKAQADCLRSNGLANWAPEVEAFDGTHACSAYANKHRLIP